VDSGQPAQLLMGVVADRNDEVRHCRDLIEAAGRDVGQVKTLAARGLDGAGGDAVRGVRPGRGGRDTARLAPEGSGQLGAGTVARADKQDAPGSVGPPWHEPIQRPRGEP
jgi:hypothetical protein